MTPDLEAVLAKVRRASLPEFSESDIDNPFVRSSWNGDTLLHVIAIWGDVESAKLLLDAGVEIDAVGEDDFTPLHEAIAQEHVEMVKLLLSLGADPTKKCMFGNAFEVASIHYNGRISLMLDAYK
jgi:ankyrin repeat protein